LRDGRGEQEKNKKKNRERRLKGKWAVVDGAQWN
jgi:hypothetical protein